jgi:hypothetical protein
MRSWILLFALLAVATPAAAKDLYVDATNGDDAVSYAANGPSAPWRTIGRAAWGSTNRSAPNGSEAARAGDTVHIAAGTYTTAGTGGRFNVAYNPVNSGSAGNPIQFVGEGTVALRLSGSRGPVIGSDGKNYITWDGFYIDENVAPPAQDTGPVTVFGATGVVVRNVQVRGIFAPWQDNHNGIRVEQANATVLQENLIFGIGSQSGYGQNDSAIMLYDSNDTVIENNELHTSGAGVFVKGQHDGQTQRRTTIRRNLIYNMGSQGVTIGPAARDGRTYQNIIRNCAGQSSAIRIYDFGTGEGREPINEVVANNTIYGCGGFHVIDIGVNNTVMNNIVDVSGTSGRYPTESVKTDVRGMRWDRQIYNAMPGGTVARLDIDGNGANYSLSTWRSTFGYDAGGNAVNPGFVAAGSNFRLTAGSAARSVGIDVLDLNGNGSTTDAIPAGAYVTGAEIIGRSGGAGPVLPPPPTGLRIIPPQ